MGLLDKN